eukprot:scaffold17406_cov116-Isochrysis_galbana.AAC.1
MPRAPTIDNRGEAQSLYCNLKAVHVSRFTVNRIPPRAFQKHPTPMLFAASMNADPEHALRLA